MQILPPPLRKPRRRIFLNCANSKTPKQYSKIVRGGDRDLIREATKTFIGEPFESLYQRWKKNEIWYAEIQQELDHHYGGKLATLALSYSQGAMLSLSKTRTLLRASGRTGLKSVLRSVLRPALPNPLLYANRSIKDALRLEAGVPLLKPSSPKAERATLQLRVQKAFLELVELYAELIAADKEYVITQPVSRLLKRDQELQRWLQQRNHNGGKKTREATTVTE